MVIQKLSNYFSHSQGLISTAKTFESLINSQHWIWNILWYCNCFFINGISNNFIIFLKQLLIMHEQNSTRTLWLFYPKAQFNPHPIHMNLMSRMTILKSLNFASQHVDLILALHMNSVSIIAWSNWLSNSNKAKK